MPPRPIIVTKKLKEEIMHMYYRQGYTSRQVAEALNIPRNRVRWVVKICIAQGWDLYGNGQKC